MDQLIELLTQIQELAGVAIDALTQAGGGQQGGAPAEGGGAPPAAGEPMPGEAPPA